MRGVANAAEEEQGRAIPAPVEIVQPDTVRDDKVALRDGRAKRERGQNEDEPNEQGKTETRGTCATLLIGFRPEHAARARLAGDDALPCFRRMRGIIERDAANRDLEVVLDLLLDCAEPFQCASAKPPWISGFAAFFGVKKA